MNAPHTVPAESKPKPRLLDQVRETIRVNPVVHTERRAAGVSPPVFRMPARWREELVRSPSVKSADGR
jgi:hypothetical protein